VVFLSFFATMHVFPILSRFENTVGNTYKNSLLMGVLAFPKTIAMMVVWLVPSFLTIYVPPMTPIALCLGISGPAYICAMLYNGTFKRFEPKEENEADGDEWFIEVEDEGAEEEHQVEQIEKEDE